MTTRLILGIVALPLLSAALISPALGQGVTPDAKSFIKKWDPDNDGTLDMKEVQRSAQARFNAADSDKDGKLTQKDVEGAISPDEFKKANPDNDTTLEMNEYAALVEQRFKAANPDGDTTIEDDELTTVAGKALMGLLQP